MQNDNEKDVHTEHCCMKHGCKYGDNDCPVVLGIKKQSYPCEDCDGFVSVPASFIDKARTLVDKIEYGIVTKDEMGIAHAVREALAEIDKGE